MIAVAPVDAVDTCTQTWRGQRCWKVNESNSTLRMSERDNLLHFKMYVHIYIQVFSFFLFFYFWIFVLQCFYSGGTDLNHQGYSRLPTRGRCSCVASWSSSGETYQKRTDEDLRVECREPFRVIVGGLVVIFKILPSVLNCFCCYSPCLKWKLLHHQQTRLKNKVLNVFELRLNNFLVLKKTLCEK